MFLIAEYTFRGILPNELVIRSLTNVTFMMFVNVFTFFQWDWIVKILHLFQRTIFFVNMWICLWGEEKGEGGSREFHQEFWITYPNTPWRHLLQLAFTFNIIMDFVHYIEHRTKVHALVFYKTRPKTTEIHTNQVGYRSQPDEKWSINITFVRFTLYIEWSFSFRILP